MKGNPAVAHDTALVFPGMGPVPFAEVGRFMVANPIARDLVAVADDALGYSLVDAFRTSPGDYSEAAQVAFFVNCLACAYWAEEHLGVEPGIVAGPSFGEKAALAYTGALELPDAVRLTAEIARCLEEYFATEHRDIVTLSFVRAPRDGLDAILAELDEAGEWHEISCRIDDGFFMLSLSEHRVGWMEERLRAIGSLPLYTMRPPCTPRRSGRCATRPPARWCPATPSPTPHSPSSPTRTAGCCAPARNCAPCSSTASTTRWTGRASPRP